MRGMLVGLALVFACGSERESPPPLPLPEPTKQPEVPEPDLPPLPPTKCPVPRGAERTALPPAEGETPPAPAPAPTPPATPPACRDLGAAGARVVADLRAAFRDTREPSRLEVELGCDHLGERVDAVDLVTATAVAWELTVYRVRRDPAAPERLQVLAMQVDQEREPEQTYAARDTASVRYGEGTVPAAALDAVLPRARAALTARATIVPIPQDPHARVIRANVGDVQIHMVVRVVDSDGKDLSGRYTGPGHPDAQDDYLTLQHAARMLAEVLTAAVPLGGPGRAPSDPFRALARDVARLDPDLLQPTFPAAMYVALIGQLDDPTRIPDLVDFLGRLASSEEAEAREPDGPIGMRLVSNDGLRVDIVNALARLTGWDVRSAEDGTLRPLADVVADYQRECGAAVAAATGR